MRSRFFEVALMLAVLSLVFFDLVHRVPGASAEAVMLQSGEMTEADAARLARLRGDDRPLMLRYRCWLLGHGDRSPEDPCDFWPGAGLLFGDLGYSRVHHLPVSELIGRRLTATLSITAPAFLGGLSLALGLGLWAARRAGTRVDRLIRAGVVMGVSTPAHWLSMLAISVFAVGLRWLPSSGIGEVGGGLLDFARHALLPISVLGLLYASHWTRYTRDAVVEALSAPHVLTARAKGLPEHRVLLDHVLRGALIPVMTVVIQSLPAMFGGALVIERAFSYPGIGLLILESIHGDDHLVALALFLALAFLVMLATSLAETVYRWLDPRLGFEQDAG